MFQDHCNHPIVWSAPCQLEDLVGKGCLYQHSQGFQWSHRPDRTSGTWPVVEPNLIHWGMHQRTAYGQSAGGNVGFISFRSPTQCVSFRRCSHCTWQQVEWGTPRGSEIKSNHGTTAQRLGAGWGWSAQNLVKLYSHKCLEVRSGQNRASDLLEDSCQQEDCQGEKMPLLSVPCIQQPFYLQWKNFDFGVPGCELDESDGLFCDFDLYTK